jgi:hypothetical protein
VVARQGLHWGDQVFTSVGPLRSGGHGTAGTGDISRPGMLPPQRAWKPVS